MHGEMALQKLNELREVVDGDVAEMVDTLATIVILKQEVSNPMYGAKVTFYELPEGEWVEIDEEEFPYDKEEYVDHEVDLDVDKHWMWRVTQKDDGWQFKRYYAYTEKQKVDRGDVPEPFDPEKSLEHNLDVAENHEDDWEIYEADFIEFRRRRLVEPELQARNAIVYDPMLSELPSDMKMWDPNRGEYTTPDDYPMGTVNLIVSEQGEFGEDYTYGVEVETSVTPANGEPTPHTYTPGWT
jgi:hypothetical protein